MGAEFVCFAFVFQMRFSSWGTEIRNEQVPMNKTQDCMDTRLIYKSLTVSYKKTLKQAS